MFSRERVDVYRNERMGGNSSSIGCQLKWKHDNMFVKLDYLGYQSIAEYLVYKLLTFSDLAHCLILPYYLCDVYEDGVFLGKGCYSFSYIEDGCSEISLKTILISNDIPLHSDYATVVDLVEDLTGLHFAQYLNLILKVDALVLNDDRHFGNLSIIRKPDGKYIFPPIYDNGSALLSETFMYPMGEDLHSLISSVYFKPFYTDYKRQLFDTYQIRINYSEFKKCRFPNTEEFNRALDVLDIRMRNLEGVIWIPF